MSTRNIVPREDNQGSIGTALKKWAGGFFTSLVVTTINALTLAAQSVGFTVSGGTISKTLTVSGDSTVNQNVSTTGSPTFANITDSGLTASVPVLTDSNKKLISGTLTGTGTQFVTSQLPTITSPTLVTPALGIPASGDLQNCTAGNTTTKGVIRLATNAKSLAGTDTNDAITSSNLKYVLDSRIPMYYGVSWDESADTYTRIGSTAGQSLGVTLTDAFLPIQRRMRRCLLNDDGTVNYYLSPTNSALKEDGVTASVLDGPDGQVMVEIPKFWYRYGYSGTTHTWEISPVPLGGFSVHPAFLSDTTELDYVYVGAYEGVLYDTSELAYNGGCYQTSVSAVFDTSDNSITIATRTGWATNLTVGQKLAVTGTSSNNGTITVKTIKSAAAITVDENITDETAATTVIQSIMDATATTGDKLSSVSGFLPITGNGTVGTRAHFRVFASNRGSGWSQAFHDVDSMLQLLYLIEYASFYSQSVIGAGITNVSGWEAYNDYNPISKTGNSNAIGNVSGNTAGATSAATEATKYMSYRGVENLYGHLWKWRDGININNNIPYICNNISNFADNTATNYTRPKDVLGADVTLHNADGYQSTLAKCSKGFLPASVGASSATKITDSYWRSTGWRVALSGGGAHYARIAGVCCLYAACGSGDLSREFSGRVVFRK